MALTTTMFGLSLALPFPPARPPAPDPVPEPEPVNWAPPLGSDVVSRGNSLSHALGYRGFDSAEIGEITRQLRLYRDPRLLRSGVALRFSSVESGTPDRISLPLNADSILHFARRDSLWTTHIELIPFVMDTVRIAGVIESSLWSARLGGDLDRFRPKDFEELVYDLADVLAWKVDFTRDLRRSDSLKVVLERKVRPDGTIRSRHFLAIELKNRDRIVRAIPQTLPGERYAYFDEEGRSLRGAFLRYPVPYRITSRFTSRRYHPVLKRYRAHEGIDYGAPVGAPVEATASGVVARAGFYGGYGRLVELRHPQGIRTRYAHLRSIAPDVRPGVSVAQGQIIGRVGSSGMATGPHLHYEFLQNGSHRNPLTVEVPSAPSIAPSRWTDFVKTRDQALALLWGVSFEGGSRYAAKSASDSSKLTERVTLYQPPPRTLQM